jgi:hypothetical protein
MGETVRVKGGDITARWRGTDDLAGLLVTTSAYTVTSVVAQPSSAALRAAEAEYPFDAAVFLQIPDGVPERVRDLARDVAGEAATPYDRALLIERFLRGYTYNLEVPSPPTDRDFVDYFLFDLEEGYCDYYSTAFVVMARTVGLPTRLAIGYVSGEAGPSPWDRVVVEENAHSWPEVYFPEWGWIRFEPTAARAEIRQYLEEEDLADELERLPHQPLIVNRSWIWAAILFGCAMVMLLATWIVNRRRDRIPEGGLTSAWKMLVQAGSTLGSSHQPGQTVFDYAAVLSEVVAERAARARWQRRKWFTRADQVKRMLDQFALAYSHHLYGAGPEGDDPPAELWHELARIRTVPLIPRRDR